MKPRLLDLFCGAGLAADGYGEAGWDMAAGVDIEPQPHYPYPFIRDDALAFMREMDPGILLTEVDAIHASPPCQFLTRAKHLRSAQGGTARYPELLTPTLELLRSQPIPWVVENVEGAKEYMQPQPGETLVRVCGSSFGLEVQRHRLFLSNAPIAGTICHHERFPLDSITKKPRPWGVYHVPKDNIPHGGRTAIDDEHAARLFRSRRLPWASLKEGFPPAYTEWIGRQLLQVIEKERAA